MIESVIKSFVNLIIINAGTHEPASNYYLIILVASSCFNLKKIYLLFLLFTDTKTCE